MLLISINYYIIKKGSIGLLTVERFISVNMCGETSLRLNSVYRDSIRVLEGKSEDNLIISYRYNDKNLNALL